MPDAHPADTRDALPLLAALAEIAGDCVVRLGPNGRVEWISQRGLAFLGLAPKDVIGRDWFELAVPAGERENVRLGHGQVPAPGALLTDAAIPLVMVTPSGKRPVRWLGSVVEDADGRPIGQVGVLVDNTDRNPARLGREKLTERLEAMVLERTRTLNRMNRELMLEVAVRREAEEAMAAAKAAAETANRAKSAFLANISHEIRTPMNGILGMTQLLAATSLDAEQQAHLADIEASAAALLVQIQTLLDFSRIETGQEELSRDLFDPRGLLSSVEAALGCLARDKKLGLAVEVDLAVPEILVGDAGHLRQVLLLLAGNAIKFTPRGGIVVGAHCVAAQAAPDAAAPPSRLDVLFSVADTGIGIRPEDVSRIFESFTQGDDSSTRRFGGTGLGLSICKHLVALMGGNLEVESEPGRGSVFSFTLGFDLEQSPDVPQRRSEPDTP